MLAKKAERSIKSLALNVHFKHPDLGMKEYEILSRATAFLLSVDPPEDDSSSSSSSAYSHIAKSQEEREKLLLKQDYAYDPAGGPQRKVEELGWLEFCPGKFRPLAHVVAASHVLSPWMWKNYYPQPWLEQITQEHVRYSVDVYDPTVKDKSADPLATYGANPYPIHHPNNMDLALVHLKSEEGALEQMQSLGVEMLHLTDTERMFNRGDEVLFDGFEIAEDHYEALENMNDQIEKDKQEVESGDDTRVFMPYNITGELIFASPERFLASTETPLPEGVCGGPVLDDNGRVCGIVEGIVPKDHDDKRLAGAASFIPYFQLKQFINFAEEIMLEKVVPKKIFDKITDLKQGKGLNHESKLNMTGNGDTSISSNVRKSNAVDLDAAYMEMVASMRQAHTSDQVDAIIGTVEREQQEVLDIIERDGGDLDEIIATVRMRTREKQREILEQMQEEAGMQEAEIISEDATDAKSSPSINSDDKNPKN